MRRYDERNPTQSENVIAMPAPRDEPWRKICVSLPTRILDRIDRYPGLQSWKIEILLDYALDMGALMTPEEARAKLLERAEEIARVADKVAPIPTAKKRAR